MARNRAPRMQHPPQKMRQRPTMTPAVAMKLQQAIAHQQRGELMQAELLYHEILARAPRHFDALHLLGVVRSQQGQYHLAVNLIKEAIRQDPNQAAAYSNLGLALEKLKKLDEALACHEHALSLKPDLAELLYNHGNALLALKRSEGALASYDRALALKPAYPQALINRGNALLDLQRPEDALASHDRALALKPDYADALNNRGNILLALKRPADALASLDRALGLKPDFAEALNNRGNVLLALKRPADALASLDRALDLKPDFAEAMNNRAHALRDLHRHEDASAAFARLLELAPDYPFAKGALLHTRMLCCNWTGVATIVNAVRDDIRAGRKSGEPFGYQAVSDSLQDLRRCAEIFAAERFPGSPDALRDGTRYDNAKIRIGYLAGEFRQQATAVLTTGLFELHDRTRFETVAFDNGWDDGGELRRRIEKAFDEMVGISRLSDHEAATMIRQKRIDILVNLNGYFGDGRHGVFTHRASPIQVNYLGFPGTLGADYIDYIVADRHVLPPEHEAFYTEKVVRLPDSYQANDSKRRIAERTPTRDELELPDSGFVFCCFNNNYKITPQMFDVWMRLLRNVPGSVLWLLEDNPEASRNLRREAESRAVAAQRLVFAPRVKLDEHLARHRQADLFLDTLPYNAHTTASDALWAGLPVLTCMGSAFAGRVAGSLLHAIGLPELITHRVEDYEALALELARAPNLLRDLRTRLAQNRTVFPLFDTARFRRHIESAYIQMWERYQRGLSPEGFDVQPIAAGRG
jgi:protein O-GlcNAc transferase